MIKVSQLILRVMAIVVLVFLSGQAALQALSTVVALTNPAQALQIMPNSTSRQKTANVMLLTQPDNIPWNKITELARSALREDPIASRGLVHLGLNYENEGQQSLALEAMSLSQTLSRRDLIAQFWLSQQAAREGKIEKYFEHSDIAFTVNAQSNSIMIPQLTRAISEPEVQAVFGNYIRQKPIWLPEVINQILSEIENPAHVADTLMLAGGLPEGDVFRAIEGKVINRLIGKGDIQTAKKYFLSLDAKNNAILSNTRFFSRNVNPATAPMTWGILTGHMSEGNFTSSEDGKSLDLQGQVAPTGRGEIARKLLFLTPGRYQVSATGEVDDDGEGSGAFAILSCASGRPNGELMRYTISPKPILKTVELPSTCIAYYMTIEIRASDGQFGLISTIYDIKLDKL
ncbi:hypothetical protein [Parasphingorhabdus halotolerans]|uniref:Uncharacterized protein n=1 Tax=Parasphingorhabdus halotolerans TaxID=2725558 RepID=A0A6H2DNP5_9SPHN|nr:hypothetical protein [Parasphingorhabdus halotolerans]QJB69757.1 hypothetical protein HF685_11110 [Parasphingorhabdus halotolerans]